MSVPVFPTGALLADIAGLHRQLADKYDALAQLGCSADAATPASMSAPSAPVSAETAASPAAPARRPGRPSKAPESAASAPAPAAPAAPAPAAPAAPAPAPAAPAAEAPTTAFSQADVIKAMQAHAAANKANGGAVATLKLIKSLNKDWSSAASIPAEERVRVIAALKGE